MRCTIYHTIISPNGSIVINFDSHLIKDEYVLFKFSDNLFDLSHVFSKHELGFSDRYCSLEHLWRTIIPKHYIFHSCR